MNFAEKIKSLRMKKKLTQEEFAKELNFAISAVRNYENVKNPRIPERERLKKIADFYGVDMGYLLDDDIQNKSRTNIDLSRELGGLSDESIEKIKNLDSYMYSFDFFLKCTDLKGLMKKIEEYRNLQDINRRLNKLSDLICSDFKEHRNISDVKQFIKYERDIKSIYILRIKTDCMKSSRYDLKGMKEKLMQLKEDCVNKIAKEKLNVFLKELADYKETIIQLQTIKEYQLQKEIMSIMDNMIKGDNESGNT